MLVFQFNLWLNNKLPLEKAHTNILMVRAPFKLCNGLKMNLYTNIARPKNKEMSRRNRDIDRQINRRNAERSNYNLQGLSFARTTILLLCTLTRTT